LLDDDKVIYTHATYDDGTLWLNGKPAFVGTSESSKTFRADRLGVQDGEDREYDYTCGWCDVGMDEPYYLEGYDGHLCENCYNEHAVLCPECKCEIWNEHTKYDKETELIYCMECYDTIIEEREEAKKIKEEELEEERKESEEV
jgi:hypothetical protein